MAEDIKLMKGNEAIAHAAIRYGVDGYFGYPITPQSEILETLMAEMPWEKTGMVVLQAESEVAAINDLFFQSGRELETRRYFLYRGSGASLSDRERYAWRSRIRNDPAESG